MPPSSAMSHLLAMRKVLLLLLISLFNSALAYAATLSGKVTDERGEALGFATIYIKTISKGTVANADGVFSIDLPAGNHTIEFRYVGYQTINKIIDLPASGFVLNVTLPSSGVTTKTVTISQRDPAYSIIKKASRKKSVYQNELKVYTAKAYLKGLNRITKFPKKIMGQEINLTKEDTLSKGVIYLSEAVSELNQSNKDMKEVVIASKVSGEPKGISINNYLMLRNDIYRNIVKIPTATRGVVSPIADNASLYYKFYLEDTYYDNGVKIFKISCEPRRDADPAFSGYVYIQDSTYRVHAYDLIANKAAGLQIIDSVGMKSIYLPVGEKTWAVGMQQLSFKFGIFGIKGEGYFTASISDYNLTPNFSKKFFKDKVVLKADTTIYNNSDKYWDSVRAVPLTDLEKLDYKVKDSLRVVEDTAKKAPDTAKVVYNTRYFLSYLNPKSFKTKIGVLGYSKPLVSTAFNPVEGYVLYNNLYLRRAKTTYTLDPRYGFASNRFYLKGGMAYNKKNRSIELSAGDHIFQYNEQAPVSDAMISSYAIFAHRHMSRLYRKEFINAKISDKLARDFNYTLGAEFARRRSLTNNSTYSYRPKNKNGTPYDSNVVLDNIEYTGNFGKHTVLTLYGELRYRPNTYSIDHPSISGSFSNNPTFRLGYRTAIGVSENFGSDYARAYIGLSHNMNFGLVGNSSIDAEAGAFLYKNKLAFQDFVHFNGNRTIFPPLEITGAFMALPYYQYSTASNYARVNLTHNFGGFIFNKIPGVRKAKLHEMLLVNSLYTEKAGGVLEVGGGIGNIFKVLTVGYSTTVVQKGPQMQQVWVRLIPSLRF